MNSNKKIRAELKRLSKKTGLRADFRGMESFTEIYKGHIRDIGTNKFKIFGSGSWKWAIEFLKNYKDDVNYEQHHFLDEK